MNYAFTSRAIAARQRAAGFTLIELMIVVAIVAILAAVAMPSYKDYVRRGKIPEGLNGLSDYRTKMEQYYQDNRNYGSSSTTCADATSANGWNSSSSGSFVPPGAKYFTYACTPDTVTNDTTQQSYTFTASATLMGGSTADHVYTIDQDGNRKTKVYKGNTVNASCWLTNSTSC